MEPRHLFLAAFCFAWGGLVLLAAAPFGPLLWFCLGGWFVALLFLVGWYHLAVAIVRDPRRPGFAERRLSLAVFATSIGMSAMSFGISAWLVPLLPSGFPYLFWWRIDWVLVLVYGLFLFIPSVYGPILVGHGILFALAPRDATSIARPYLIAAGTALIEIAAIGIAAQILWTPDRYQFFYYVFTVFPGLTGPAYGLAAFGLWREHRFALGPIRGAASAPRT